jgi:hypothetical protein
MEEIPHDAEENPGVSVKRGKASMKDVSQLEGNAYGVDDSGRTIVPRVNMNGGVDGSTNPFGNPMVLRVIDQDEDGFKVLEKKVVTGASADDAPIAPPAPAVPAKAGKKKAPTTADAQYHLTKIAELEAVIASQRTVVPEPVKTVARAPVMATLSGAFGSMTMPYYVIQSGGSIVLVSEISSAMPAYTPPEQIPIEVNVNNSKTKVMHLGLEFVYEGKRLLVLIIDS